MADDDGTPPRSKTVKRIRYKQKFKPEYCSEFKFISKSRAGETRFVCSVVIQKVTSLHQGSCHSQQFSTGMIRSAKSAT